MLDRAQRNGVLTNTIFAISGALILTIYTLCQFYSKSTRRYPPQGCRRLGLPTNKTNLCDEYDPKYNQGVPQDSKDEQGRPAWRVKALFTYPIKSCAGVELGEADVVSTGFAFDRQFCFAEGETSANGEVNWTARTLRNKGFNKLALVHPEIWLPDSSAPGYKPGLEEVKSRSVMVVKYPRTGTGCNALHSAIIQAGIFLKLIPHETSFTLPLYPPENPDQKGHPQLTRVKIWKDNPLAYNYGHYIPPSFHRFISQNTPSLSQKRENNLTIFRVNPSHPREIYRNAPRKADLGFQPTTGFADAYPLHILSLSSVRDVNAHCEKDIPCLSIRRFRANVIVQGPGAFVEDDWKVIRLEPVQSVPRLSAKAQSSNGNHSAGDSGEGTVIYTACRTIRCKLPNVDPDTGHRHPSEPDRTLKSYRKIDRGDLTNACLGMQGVPAVRGKFSLLIALWPVESSLIMMSEFDGVIMADYCRVAYSGR